MTTKLKRYFVRKEVLGEDGAERLRDRWDYTVQDGGRLWIIHARGIVPSIDLSEDPISALEDIAGAHLLISGDTDITWWGDTRPSGGGIRAALGEFGPMVIASVKKSPITRAEEMQAISHAARARGERA